MFTNDQIRQHRATAAWFLFHASVKTFIQRAPMLEGTIKLANRSSKSKKFLGTAVYVIDKNITEINASPWSILEHCERTLPANTGFGRHLRNVTIHCAAHEVAHAIIFQSGQFVRDNKLIVDPHGDDWKWVMEAVFQIKNCGPRPGTQIPDKWETETEFWNTIDAKFMAWRNGSTEF